MKPGVQTHARQGAGYIFFCTANYIPDREAELVEVARDFFIAGPFLNRRQQRKQRSGSLFPLLPPVQHFANAHTKLQDDYDPNGHAHSAAGQFTDLTAASVRGRRAEHNQGDPRTTGKTKRRLNAQSASCNNREKHAVFGTAYEY